MEAEHHHDSEEPAPRQSGHPLQSRGSSPSLQSWPGNNGGGTQLRGGRAVPRRVLTCGPRARLVRLEANEDIRRLQVLGGFRRVRPSGSIGMFFCLMQKKERTKKKVFLRQGGTT